MSKLDPEIENTILGTKGMLNFFDQFGKDVYSLEFFTILFEELMNMTPEQIFEETNEKSESAEKLPDTSTPETKKEYEGNSEN